MQKRWPLLLQATLLAAATLWIYWPALNGGWLWDDNIYITGNPLLNDPDRLWKTWFEPGNVDNYFPITATAQYLEWALWGNDTLGYHMVNVFLHFVGALLVWRLFAKLQLRLAWLGGLLFAVHPAQVESVAWIVELKNTLSLLPFLCAMIVWIDYDERRRSRDYFIALGLFLVAMLCKSTLVMFPVVILLYAWWKRGRLGWRDVIAATPFFIISLVLGLITMQVSAQFPPSAPEKSVMHLGGIASRLACSGLIASFYFIKCLLPVDLMTIYPQWSVDPPSPIQFLPWLVFAAAAGWFWTKRQSWGRHVLLGLGFFFIMLAPMLGFVPIITMKYTWVMDHYLYVPCLGLIALVIAALGRIDVQLPRNLRVAGVALAAVLVGGLAVTSHFYAGLYRGEVSLWAYNVQRNPLAWPAYNNLGYAYWKLGRMPEAIVELNRALALNHDYPEAHNNLGLALLDSGHTAQAVDQFEQALKLFPEYPAVHNNLGVALAQTGHFAEAMAQFETVLRVDPNFGEARENLARLQAQAQAQARAAAAAKAKK